MEITKREIIVSICIIAVMLILGLLISDAISDYQLDVNEKYYKAVKIDNTELFQYGMKTNIGNAFVYGDLLAVDTVSYPNIGGEYMYVKRIKEKYTKHTRTVTKTRKKSDGKTETYTEIETYYTWDAVKTEDMLCNEVSFQNIVFSSNKFNIPSANYIDTIKESSNIRYKYYGTDIKFTGTIFTELKDNTISDNTNFYNNLDIDQTVEYVTSNGMEIGFWIIWIILIILTVYGFYYIDNKWLE